MKVIGAKISCIGKGIIRFYIERTVYRGLHFMTKKHPVHKAQSADHVSMTKGPLRVLDELGAIQSSVSGEE